MAPAKPRHTVWAGVERPYSDRHRRSLSSRPDPDADDIDIIGRAVIAADDINTGCPAIIAVGAFD
jgi:hypothetical protein